MRILFITENLPYPLDSGGRIRSFHTLKGLARRHDVTLATSCPHIPSEGISILRSICSTVCVAEKTSASAAKQALSCATGLFKSAPILLSRHFCESLAKLICEETGKQAFDAVHYDHLDSTIYSRFVQSVPFAVLDEHNIVSNQVRTTASAHPNRLLRIMLRAEWLKMRRYESAACAAASRCLVCSDADGKSLLQLAPLARFEVIPNGVDVSYFSAQSQIASSLSAPVHGSTIFVGTLDYLPCDLAVRHFITDILPLIKEKTPSASFCVVGANPSSHVRKLAESCPAVTLTGRVPDTRPYLAKSQVCVVPLKSGSGTRLKILEAMAAGVPVVSTSIGAEGLDVKNEKHLLLADTAQDFATAVVRLTSNPELVHRLQENAFSLVRSRYDWSVILQKLTSIYDSLVLDVNPRGETARPAGQA
jgi:polysaccharide biosynthesis protein PslH